MNWAFTFSLSKVLHVADKAMTVVHPPIGINGVATRTGDIISGAQGLKDFATVIALSLGTVSMKHVLHGLLIDLLAQPLCRREIFGGHVEIRTQILLGKS